MFVALRLARAGYFSGDPMQVLNAPVDVVQDAIAFEAFETDYKTEYSLLNKK